MRALLDEQRKQTRALEELVKVVRVAAMGRTSGGFITGLVQSGSDEVGGVSFTTNQDMAELLEVEQELSRAFGRPATEEEVVAAWTRERG
jgi:hypothetical protein